MTRYVVAICRLKALYDRAKRFIAYALLRLLYGRADYGVDYTSRCPGCGYFDGEDAAGRDHYGYSCVPVDVGCWWPVVDWLHGRLAGTCCWWRKISTDHLDVRVEA